MKNKINFDCFKTLLKKTEEYNKKATNPFLKARFEESPFKNIYEQTYIWITKNDSEIDSLF